LLLSSKDLLSLEGTAQRTRPKYKVKKKKRREFIKGQFLPLDHAKKLKKFNADCANCAVHPIADVYRYLIIYSKFEDKLLVLTGGIFGVTRRRASCPQYFSLSLLSDLSLN
jgi:hypothetical protein